MTRFNEVVLQLPMTRFNGFVLQLPMTRFNEVVLQLPMTHSNEVVALKGIPGKHGLRDFVHDYSNYATED